jgi:hypothetical protein
MIGPQLVATMPCVMRRVKAPGSGDPLLNVEVAAGEQMGKELRIHAGLEAV